MLVFLERTRKAVINQTNAGTVFEKQCWKNFEEIGWSAHRLFQVHVLNWTDINLQARPTVLPTDDCVSRVTESSREQTCTMSIHHFRWVDSGH